MSAVRAPAHCTDLEPCPHLPEQASPLTAAVMRPFRTGDRGEAFYETALCYAQSLWLQGVPAQALLLVNRAMGADLRGDEPVLARWPMPYAAVVWLMRHRGEDHFIGNPRRHYQHLATRMVEPRKVPRTWRAWACRLLADRLFDPRDYPDDSRQVAEEGLVFPTREEVLAGLEATGLPGEVPLFLEADAAAAAG